MDVNVSVQQVETIVVQSYDKDERVSRDKKKLHRRHPKTCSRVAEDGTISSDVTSSPGPPMTSVGKSRRKTNKTLDDIDDAASICSSTSSEHSLKNTKSKNRGKSLTYCELHSKSTTQHKPKILEGSPSSNGNTTALVNDNGAPPSARPTIPCTCTFKDAKSSRSSRGDRVKRPEPEGSILVDSFKGYGPLDEFERIIYSDEPMFSDLEDDPAVDELVREESDRLHKKSDALGASRGGGGGDSLFSAAQSLNSSTIIKLAIIGNELKNVKDASLRRAEGDMTSVARRMEHLEKSFTQAADHLDLASKHLAEAIILFGYKREEVLRQMQPHSEADARSRLAGGGLDKPSSSLGSNRNNCFGENPKVTRQNDISQPISTKSFLTLEIPPHGLSEIYNVSVRNRFEALTYIKEDMNFEWNSSAEEDKVQETTTASVTPSKNKPARQPLLTAESMAALDKKMAALLAGDTAWWKALRAILKAGAKEDLEKWFECLARDAAEATALTDDDSEAAEEATALADDDDDDDSNPYYCDCGAVHQMMGNCYRNKLIVNVRDVEEAEQCLDDAELRVHELEEELKTVSGVKPKNCSEQEHKAWIQRLRTELTEADKWATSIEEHILHLKMKYSKSQDESTAEMKKYKPISRRLNVSFAELYESFFQ